MTNFIGYILHLGYPLTLTVGFVLLFVLIKLKVKGIEIKRISSMKRRTITNPIETDAPVDEASELNQKGVEGLENHFAFINKSFPIILIMIWGVLISIPYLGKVPSVYISIIAAIGSVLVGFALRPFLENLFSGVVISFFRAIRIGDTVIIDGHYGLIEEIGLTYSVLKRWDWCRVVIPNSKLLNKEIENFTLNDRYLWAHIEFFVEPTADLVKVEYEAKNAARTSRHFSHAEDPAFWIIAMEKDSIKCWLAAWADNPLSAWQLRHEMRTNTVRALQKEGIGFHIHQYNETPNFLNKQKVVNE